MATAEQTKGMTEALDLRLAGLSFRDIAERQGCGIATAHRRVEKALKLTLHEPAEHIRTLCHLRYERLLQAIWPSAIAGDEKAIGQALTVIERIARLHGLSEPPRIPIDVIVAQIAREEGIDPAEAARDADAIVRALPRRA